MRVIESKIVEINPTTGAMLMFKKIRGLSSEVSNLPTNVCTGSEFLEIDNGKTIYFDETNSEWVDPTEESADPAEESGDPDEESGD